MEIFPALQKWPWNIVEARKQFLLALRFLRHGDLWWSAFPIGSCTTHLVSFLWFFCRVDSISRSSKTRTSRQLNKTAEKRKKLFFGATWYAVSSHLHGPFVACNVLLRKEASFLWNKVWTMSEIWQSQMTTGCKNFPFDFPLRLANRQYFNMKIIWLWCSVKNIVLLLCEV